MTRSRFAIASVLGAFAATWATSVAAETAYASDGATGSFLKILTDRLDFTIRQVPALGRHLGEMPSIIGGHTALLLVGIVVGGLLAEYLARALLSRVRTNTIDRL